MVLAADGEKQSMILRAEGQAEAMKRVADAEKYKTEVVYQAIHNGNPTKDLIAIKYLETLQKMSEGPATKILLPLEISGLAGAVTAAAELMKDTTTDATKTRTQGPASPLGGSTSTFRSATPAAATAISSPSPAKKTAWIAMSTISVSEIPLYASPDVLSTVFFGGGTPSILEEKHLEKIFDAIHHHLRLDRDAEITLEANPESITLEKVNAWKSVGINRISLGLQAFDDALLKKMDRLHNVRQFLDAYQTVRYAGFDNVSVDLIYGFAEQTLDDWQNTVRKTVELKPEHLLPLCAEN